MRKLLMTFFRCFILTIKNIAGSIERTYEPQTAVDAITLLERFRIGTPYCTRQHV